MAPTNKNGKTLNSDIRTCTPSIVTKCIHASVTSRRPLFIWGPPGVGKSSLVAQVAKELDMEFRDLRLSQLDAVDLRGLPMVDKTDPDHPKSEYAQPSFLPSDEESRGILFLDEMPQAALPVLNAASQLLLDRQIGDYILPKGWVMIAAGNRRTDRAGTHEIPSHLKNRLIHIEMEASHEEWLTWAAAEAIHPDVIRFIKSQPTLLNQFDSDKLACATSRSWFFVSEILHGKPDKVTRQAMVAGAVGLGTMQQFESFLDRDKDLPSYEDIVADPKKAHIPTKGSDQFTLMESIAQYAKIGDVDALLDYFERPEIVYDYMPVVIGTMVNTDPAFAKHPRFKAMNDKVLKIKK